MRIALLSLTCLLAICAFGCRSDAEKGSAARLAEGDLTPDEKARIVARVGDTVITLEEFEQRLDQQSPFARARYDSLQRKQEFLDSLVRFELIAQEAERKGYGDHPDVVLARKQAMVRQFTRDELTDLVKLDQITEADIAGYFNEHRDEFDRPEQVRAAHILIADEQKARSLQAEVAAAIAADPTKPREIFAEFARRYTEEEEGRISGGDLKFFGKPGESKVQGQSAVPTPVATAAFAIADIGAMAPEPVHSSQGWHIVQKTGMRRAYQRALDDVRTQIRNKLFRLRKSEAMEKYVTDLKARARIVIDDAVLEKAKAPAAAGGLPELMPRAPGAIDGLPASPLPAPGKTP
ncbi:MAG: peptidyl-prolyl cis-trans isomerase [Myxococcales bacterium]|nr:peptidyl-prolyl cis-trans isomerase [Myxococcales bacterium]